MDIQALTLSRGIARTALSRSNLEEGRIEEHRDAWTPSAEYKAWKKIRLHLAKSLNKLASSFKGHPKLFSKDRTALQNLKREHVLAQENEDRIGDYQKRISNVQSQIENFRTFFSNVVDQMTTLITKHFGVPYVGKVIEAVAEGATTVNAPQKRKLRVEDAAHRENLMAIYLESIGDTPRLTRAEEIAYLRKIETGDSEARNEFIRINTPLVIHVARKYKEHGKRAGLSLLDLVQDGNVGLTTSVENFVDSYGVRFATHAFFWIQRSIERALDEAEGASEESRKLDRIRERLFGELGRDPTAQEVLPFWSANPKGNRAAQKAELLRLTELLNRPRRFINDHTVEDEEDWLEEMVESPNGTAGIDAVDAKDALRKAFNSIYPIERAVITLRRGLGNGRSKSQKKVGELIGRTRARAGQIEDRARAKIRKALHALEA